MNETKNTAENKRAAAREKKIAACVVRETSWGHEVTSPSGNTYRVVTRTIINRHDGAMTFRRECDCPAHGDCVHIAAVDRHIFTDGDADEVMERTY